MAAENAYKAFDERDLEEVFEKFYHPLCHFASGYLNDHESAEEIVQQVFINLWDQRSTMDAKRNIKSYLYTSVKNRCLNYIRDNKKFRSYYLDVELELEIAVPERDLPAESDLARQINQALDKLPEKCREVFMLCRFEELKYKEVAQRLNISQKTVEAQMSKALKILKEELKDVWLWLMICGYLGLK